MYVKASPKASFNNQEKQHSKMWKNCIDWLPGKKYENKKNTNTKNNINVSFNLLLYCNKIILLHSFII